MRIVVDDRKSNNIRVPVNRIVSAWCNKTIPLLKTQPLGLSVITIGMG